MSVYFCILGPYFGANPLKKECFVFINGKMREKPLEDGYSRRQVKMRIVLELLLIMLTMTAETKEAEDPEGMNLIHSLFQQLYPTIFLNIN